MKEKRRCSILFHLLVPGGRWLTTMSRSSSLASFCSSRFHKRTREPLLPPPSAVISNRVASGYRARPRLRHHWRMLFTAKAAVSWSTPTLTHPIFAPVVTEIPDQFLFLGVDGDHRLLFGQSGGHLGVDVAELRIPVGVTVALCGLTVALQTVTRLIEQVADQGAADLVTLGLQRLRQPAHAFAGPPQRRFRVTPCRRLDQRIEIVKQRVVLGDRSPASSSRPPNALRGLVRRQFLQAPSDGARRNPGRHRDRRNPAITRGKRLRCRNQTPAAFIEKRRHRRKPLSNGFDIDHHHNIWYGKSVVNPYLTLSKVDSIISGRALRGDAPAASHWFFRSDSMAVRSGFRMRHGP